MKIVKKMKREAEVTRVGLRFLRSYCDTYGGEEYVAIYTNGRLRGCLLLLAKACGEGRIDIPKAMFVMHIIYEIRDEF